MKGVLPTYLGKTNTFLQILLVLVVMFSLAFEVDLVEFKDWIIYFVTATTLASGAQYSSIWGWKAIAFFRKENYREK